MTEEKQKEEKARIDQLNRIEELKLPLLDPFEAVFIRDSWYSQICTKTTRKGRRWKYYFDKLKETKDPKKVIEYISTDQKRRANKQPNLQKKKSRNAAHHASMASMGGMISGVGGGYESKSDLLRGMHESMSELPETETLLQNRRSIRNKQRHRKMESLQGAEFETLKTKINEAHDEIAGAGSGNKDKTTKTQDGNENENNGNMDAKLPQIQKQDSEKSGLSFVTDTTVVNRKKMLENNKNVVSNQKKVQSSPKHRPNNDTFGTSFVTLCYFVYVYVYVWVWVCFVCQWSLCMLTTNITKKRCENAKMKMRK